MKSCLGLDFHKMQKVNRHKSSMKLWLERKWGIGDLKFIKNLFSQGLPVAV